MTWYCDTCGQNFEDDDPHPGCPRSLQKLPSDPTGSTAGKVFSGVASQELWGEINQLDATSTGDDIRDVLYSIGCALQRLESKIDSR